MMGKSAPAHMETELYHLLATGQKSKTEKLIFKTCDFKDCDNGAWTYLDVKQYKQTYRNPVPLCAGEMSGAYCTGGGGYGQY